MDRHILLSRRTTEQQLCHPSSIPVKIGVIVNVGRCHSQGVMTFKHNVNTLLDKAEISIHKALSIHKEL